MKTKLFFTVAAIATIASGGAYAQSNGDYSRSKGEANMLNDAKRIETPVMKNSQSSYPAETETSVNPQAGDETNPFADFTGVYAGVQGGYTLGNFDVDSATVNGDADVDGFEGGVFAGYGFEHNFSWIGSYAGVEVAYNWSDADDDVDGTSFSKDEAFVATFRPGISAYQDVLGYGIIGYTRAKFEGAGDEEHLDGLVLGAGGEFDTGTALKGRLEYTYTNYEEADLSSTEFDGHENSIKLGALMRF